VTLFKNCFASIGWVLVAALAQAAAPVKAAAPRGVSAKSQDCLTCHGDVTPGAVEQWKASLHAAKGVGCYECHQASAGDADAFDHNGELIATVVTPRDCGRCHEKVVSEFTRSHHAKAGNILASLDNFLAETVEGSRAPFEASSATPGRPDLGKVNGMASVNSGCQQCHGAKVALQATDGGRVTVDDLKPDPDGKPTVAEAPLRIARDRDGKPILVPATWPNTGIGRLNLDGSLGSCSACHSRHDFSRRRARQPENCGKCHLGPDHPQKEIYDESKHGVAFRDLREKMNLDARPWVLGKDYTQAPTCATCHLSANVNGGKVTHDPGERISWTNRPTVSLVMDTDEEHRVVTETDPARRQAAIADTWQQKRERMKGVCTACHVEAYVDGFYKQYDDLVVLFDEKFAKPGKAIMDSLAREGLITPKQFDEKVEWTWYFLWHHEGRRARHGAAMMAPDYTHWHGMYEVADRFYMEFIPQVRELTRQAAASGKAKQAAAVNAVVDDVLKRPEHAWQGPAPGAK